MDWIAIYGAFLSSALLAWEIYKHKLAQPKVSVNCFMAVQTITPLPPNSVWNVQFEGQARRLDEDTFLALRVTNISTRDVVIEKVGGAYKDGQTFSASWNPVPLPRRLSPADSFEFAVPANVVRDDLDFLAVWDSTGRIWKAPNKETKHVKSHGATRQ